MSNSNQQEAGKLEILSLKECKDKVALDLTNGKRCWQEVIDHDFFYGTGLSKIYSYDSLFNIPTEMYAKQFQKRIEELESENFELAAYQCDKPYGDDYGNKRYSYQDEIFSLKAEVKRKDEALRQIVDIKTYNDSRDRVESARWSGIIECQEIAEQALKEK